MVPCFRGDSVSPPRIVIYILPCKRKPPQMEPFEMLQAFFLIGGFEYNQ